MGIVREGKASLWKKKGVQGVSLERQAVVLWKKRTLAGESCELSQEKKAKKFSRARKNFSGLGSPRITYQVTPPFSVSATASKAAMLMVMGKRG